MYLTKFNVTFSTKNITLEYIHTNRILNFILNIFFQGISKGNQNISYQLSTVQGKSENPPNIGASQQNYPLLIKQSGCLLVPGAVSGPRDISL